jgi:hypothetical protein
VSGGDCAQFISPLLRGASIVEIDHTGIIVRHIEPLPGPELAPADRASFARRVRSLDHLVGARAAEAER